jgi:hypothetical protein
MLSLALVPSHFWCPWLPVCTYYFVVWWFQLLREAKDWEDDKAPWQTEALKCWWCQQQAVNIARRSWIC